MISCKKMCGKKKRQVSEYEPTPHPLRDEPEEEEGDRLHVVHPSNDHKDTGRREKVRRHFFETAMRVVDSLMTDY